MKWRQAPPKNDAILVPFLEAADDGESSRLLEGLLCNNADPLIREIVGYKLRNSISVASTGESADAEDVCGEVLAQLVARLQELKTSPEEKAILNFRGYVAGMAYNACDDYLRGKYPQRSALKARLRYLLNTRSAFALWKAGDRQWLCGLEAWREKHSVAYAAPNPSFLQQGAPVENSATKVEGDNGIHGGTDTIELARVVSSVFSARGEPIEFDQLVSTVAGILGVRDQVEQISESIEQCYAASSLADDVALRQRLERMWGEICQLPVAQRVALLLNLRGTSEDNLISLFPLTNVATMRQIAQALEMPADQLAGLWNDLPLDDLSIAEFLCITRQQVINLRKSARHRLTRRAAKW
jgi:hypothetical protein